MSNTTEIHAILWDMDGTLINSEDIYIKQLNSILSAQFQSGPLSKEVVSKIQGRPGLKISEILVDEYRLGDRTSSQKFYDITNQPEQLKLYRETAFLPGIQDFLSHVKTVHNLPMAIATSTTRLKYNAKTTHLDFSFFDLTLTGGDHPRLKGKGKPQPYIWHETLAELNEKLGTNIKMENCLIFEDSVSGIQSGLAAGGKTVWIPSNPEAVKALSDEEMSYYKSNCEAILGDFLQFDNNKYSFISL